MIQIGYNRILGNNEKAIYLLKEEWILLIRQFDKNEILINNLHSDLLEFYDYQGISAGYTRNPEEQDWVLSRELESIWPWGKIYYSINIQPVYEGMKIGDNPKLQNTTVCWVEELITISKARKYFFDFTLKKFIFNHKVFREEFGS